MRRAGQNSRSSSRSKPLINSKRALKTLAEEEDSETATLREALVAVVDRYCLVEGAVPDEEEEGWLAFGILGCRFDRV